MGLQEKEKKKSLRDRMPVVAAFIDEMRNAFGEDEVNKQIRQGMAGKPTFYANENGYEIGTPGMQGGIEIFGADLIVASVVDEEVKSKRKAR